MDNLQLKKAVYIFVRLSLYDQIRLCNFSFQEKYFDTALLVSIGKVEGGVEFSRECETSISFDNLMNILNNIDIFTRQRLIDELENFNPEIAEKIKKNILVFSDIVLFDEKVIQKLIERIDSKILKIAMKGCSHKIYEHIIDSLESEEEKEKWKNDIIKIKINSLKDINYAQNEIINECKKMDEENLLEVNRNDKVSINLKL